MIKKGLIAIGIVGVGVSVSGATTLRETVARVLDSNPVIKERLHNYRATRADLRGAEAGYFPTLDLEIGIGKDYKTSLMPNPTPTTISLVPR